MGIFVVRCVGKSLPAFSRCFTRDFEVVKEQISAEEIEISLTTLTLPKNNVAAISDILVPTNTREVRCRRCIESKRHYSR